LVKMKDKAASAQGTGIAAVPCGQCLNCRKNQGNIWANRLLLESMSHGCSVFVTLTYNDDHIPDPPHLNKKHLQDYIKRLRYYVEPVKIRYFGVGEYGDRTFRPHYHIVLFGLGFLNETSIKRAWLFSEPDFVHIGELNEASAHYITKYVTKKILKAPYIQKHPVNYGKTDEFSIMSKQKGGIGKPTIDKVAERLNKYQNWKKQAILEKLRVGPKKISIGRYLKEKVNDQIGFTEDELMVLKWARQEIHFENCERSKIIETKDYRNKGVI
jgi:hypothetical protein